MIITNDFQSQNFTSRLNPVKPFKVKSKWGTLNVVEASPREMRQEGFVNALAKSLCKNFASYTDDPGWTILREPTQKDKWKPIIKYFQNNIKRIFKENDPNLTLLIARDKNKKIRGACLSYGFDEVPTAKDTALYIDSIAIDKPYRGIGLGKLMMNKTIEANRNTFNDIFLMGEVKAAGFYEKLKFKELDAADPKQNAVINFIAQDRNDYPDYIKLFTKPLQPDKPRWYDKAGEAILKTLTAPQK